jgi:hypothetical protein
MLISKLIYNIYIHISVIIKIYITITVYMYIYRNIWIYICFVYTKETNYSNGYIHMKHIHIKHTYVYTYLCNNIYMYLCLYYTYMLLLGYVCMFIYICYKYVYMYIYKYLNNKQIQNIDIMKSRNIYEHLKVSFPLSLRSHKGNSYLIHLPVNWLAR